MEGTSLQALVVTIRHHVPDRLQQAFEVSQQRPFEIATTFRVLSDRLHLLKGPFPIPLIDLLTQCGGAARCVQAIARAKLEAEGSAGATRGEEVKRQLALIKGQRARLLNLRLSGEVDEQLFAHKRAELDDRVAILQRQLTESRLLQEHIDERSKRASDVFEILEQQWLSMERRSRQLVLATLFGGFTLEGRRLVPQNGTPLELFRAG